MKETMWKEVFTASLRNYIGISTEGLRNGGGGRKKEDMYIGTVEVPAEIPTWHFLNRIQDYYSFGQLAPYIKVVKYKV